ncbi:insulinase family protein [Qipengyuania sp. SS22]|uniref:M16 family metallopeptidase n=1 Tax=Qipengyuania sp. SS22 TaxID=2979461 RepID=UPI0021E5F67F|nr:M16 family metallopeptidase [Qipengyuania sp. SS22]UYH55565.1 insulinase family protein [Qipengyuania sp. SS22]
MAAFIAPGMAVAQDEPAFVHEASDLEADPRVVYGTLDNGLRYAVMNNQTPSGNAAIRMRIGTGSLNETDAQQGIAHFLEHMAFNGSVNVPEGEMVKRLERHGLAFGADTNASTGFDQTIYKLNLPTVREPVLNEAMFLMRETAENLLLDADAIDRERGVIASEKLARDSLSYRSTVDRLRFFTEGSAITDRLPIGIAETIATMPREEFVSFYRGYYRPENTFIAFIGDVEPAVAIAKIEEYFGDWKAQGPALRETRPGPAVLQPGKVGYFFDEKLMTSVTLGALRPYEERSDTRVMRRENLVRAIGARILNRRFNRKVKQGEAAYLSGGVGRYRPYEVVDGMTLTIRTTPEDWRQALAEGEQELRRALQYGFSQDEMDEQLAIIRQSRETAVERAATRKTYAGLEYNYARELVSAFAEDKVFTSPQAGLALFEEAEPTITLEEVEREFREAWRGIENPAIYFINKEPLEDTERALKTALRESRNVAVTAPEPRNVAAFAYTDFGSPGEVISDSYLADADAHLVKFANNVRLNFKQTDFDAGTIAVRVRVGGGFMAMPRRSEALRRLGLNLLDQSGVVGHTDDDLRSLFAGQRVGVSAKTFIDNDAFELLGATDADDLSSQLNLMAAKVKAPAFSEDVAEQYFRKIRAWYPTHDSSPQETVRKYLPRLVRSGHEAYGFDDLDSFLEPTIADARAWIEPEMADGLIEISVVGDIDKQTVVEQVARTFGALPERADDKGDYPVMGDVQFPAGSETPNRFYHKGTPDQALVYVYWPAPDASDPVDRYRMRLLRGLFRNRLSDVLREEMGSTYSPGTSSYSNDLFDGYGYLYARVTAKPDEVDKVREGVLRVASEMANTPIDEDTFTRAWTPIVEDLDSSLENNSYWLSILGDAQTGASGLTRFRVREPAYRDMTAEDISVLAKEVFGGDRDISAYILPAEMQ